MDDNVEDIDTEEHDSDAAIEEPSPLLPLLDITGICDFCGKVIKGKIRRFCDVECMKEHNLLKAQDDFV